MMTMRVARGATDVSLYVVLRDALAGTPATGVTITTLDLQYTRTRSAPAAKVDLTALASTDAAHSDNQGIEIDATSSPGLYRIDMPDAAFAAGADAVLVVVSSPTTDPAIVLVQLDDLDARMKLAAQALVGKNAHDMPNRVRTIYDTDGITPLVVFDVASNDDGSIITETPR